MHLAVQTIDKLASIRFFITKWTSDASISIKLAHRACWRMWQCCPVAMFTCIFQIDWIRSLCERQCPGGRCISVGILSSVYPIDLDNARNRRALLNGIRLPISFYWIKQQNSIHRRLQLLCKNAVDVCFAGIYVTSTGYHRYHVVSQSCCSTISTAFQLHRVSCKLVRRVRNLCYQYLLNVRYSPQWLNQMRWHSHSCVDFVVIISTLFWILTSSEDKIFIATGWHHRPHSM